MPSWALAILFVFWLSVGFVLWRQSPAIKNRYRSIPRGKRIGISLMLLVFGAIVLLGGLIGVEMAQRSALPMPWALAALIFAILGGIFVAGQCLAGISLVTILEENVTLEHQNASIPQKDNDQQLD